MEYKALLLWTRKNHLRCTLFFTNTYKFRTMPELINENSGQDILHEELVILPPGELKINNETIATVLVTTGPRYLDSTKM